jgi:copper chaperone CopZ
VLAVDPRAGVLSLRVDLPLKPDRDEQAARAAQEFLASLRRGQRVATTAEVDDRGNVALVGIEPLRGTTVTLRLRGLACDACVERIEESLRSVRGVEEARASLDPMQVVVTYDPQQVSLSQLRQAVRDIEPVHPDQRYEVVE